MTLIDQEQKNSQQYLLKRDTRGRVIISEENVARVEAMIAENSRYNNALNENDTTSSKFYLTKLKSELENNDYPIFDTVYGAMRSINAENSTRLCLKELKELAERICKLSGQEIMQYLVRPTISTGPNDEKYYLVKYLTRETKIYGKRKSGRCNYSFATKFCHYACMNFFAGKPEADNYPIIDNVIKSVFPKYAKVIGLTSKEIKFNDYESFVDSLDMVLNYHRNCISRNGFDHLMWYANK